MIKKNFTVYAYQLWFIRHPLIHKNMFCVDGGQDLLWNQRGFTGRDLGKIISFLCASVSHMWKGEWQTFNKCLLPSPGLLLDLTRLPQNRYLKAHLKSSRFLSKTAAAGWQSFLWRQYHHNAILATVIFYHFLPGELWLWHWGFKTYSLNTTYYKSLTKLLQ